MKEKLKLYKGPNEKNPEVFVKHGHLMYHLSYNSHNNHIVTKSHVNEQSLVEMNDLEQLISFGISKDQREIWTAITVHENRKAWFRQ